MFINIRKLRPRSIDWKSSLRIKIENHLYTINILPDNDSNFKAIYKRANFSTGELVDITSKKL